MTAANDSPQQSQPSRRALRMWAGLLVAVWLLIQMAAVMFSFAQSVCFREQELRAEKAPQEQGLDGRGTRAGYWHASAVAAGTAALAMVFIAGGTGLVLAARWAWWVLKGGAVLQILFTVATQVWQATLPEHVDAGPLTGGSMGLMGAVIGILLWNVIPVGILILTLSARPTEA